MTEALPCFRCDRPLVNAVPEGENQPGDGLHFMSYGHYGSTTFDPMDGSFLEINICDDCLTERAQQAEIMKRDIILTGRRTRPVRVAHPRWLQGIQIGQERVTRPMLPWNPLLADDGDAIGILLEVEEARQLWDVQDKRIEWLPAALTVIKEIEKLHPSPVTDEKEAEHE